VPTHVVLEEVQFPLLAALPTSEAAATFTLVVVAPPIITILLAPTLTKIGSMIRLLELDNWAKKIAKKLK
jgi:hypothetical protein